MKKLKLTKGKHNPDGSKFALVDDWDFMVLKKNKWHVLVSGYAETMLYYPRTQKGRGLLMHRAIMWCPKGYEIDHKNHNKLDNRKENLRIATRQQNQVNAVPSSKNSSGFIGVCWDKNRKKWRANIGLDHVQIAIGRFNTKEDAALAYNRVARFVYGEFANLNAV